MKSSGLLLAIAAIGACADPVVEMSLQLPTATQLPASFDLSCVTAVDVTVAGNDKGTAEIPADSSTRCIDVKNRPASFSALRAEISGKVAVELPHSGLAAVTLRGRTGTCAEENRDYESIFYGGSAYVDGSESLSIPIVANISCDAKRSYTVSVVDMLALGTTKQCAMAVPTATSKPVVFSGNIRPVMMGSAFPLTRWDYGASWVVPDAAGKARIDSYASAVTTRSCIAVGFSSDGPFAGSCVNPGTPTLCAGANELELGVIDELVAANSFDPALVQQYGAPVFGAVWRASPAATVIKAPVAGATVELEDPTQGKVVYVEPSASKLTATAGTSTGASGMFIVYLKGAAATVTVRYGVTQQRYTIASQATLPPTLLAVLP